MGYDLSFVNLGITIQHMQNHIDVFGFRIAFYGIIIGIGMLLGIRLAAGDAKRRGLGEDVIYDYIVYGILAGIAGARLYYVFFQWEAYRSDLLQILNLRAGGLAIYGGVIGGALALLLWCRLKKQHFLVMADSLVLGVVVGQIMGRWGNFFNCEAFGRYTEGLFAMRIRREIVNPIMIDAELLGHLITENGVEYIQVHPTFLYESCWNLCLLLFLLWYRYRKRFEGELLFLYLGGYGLGRVWIEGLRTDSLLLPGTGIAVSQALAGCCVFAAAVGIIYFRRKSARKSR
ncbi:phosphatidylglycerol:prolipoprotein diacylglycerol transferase [Fusobacterium naviforme]|uniref:Phosphatidylglycerol--prolipoprotein diacylglyceryl transferase n=1 Tax=Moryella indoligenes TaxID=371674 RepID=A0AAE4AL72_9FIRM|nr:prolipoprotein diacylglyceryl transferase [Moryella indoligenes]KAB0578798.1 prolipoprotein diacylglyceryl transferase [Fusobacterium naviforme]MDQ0151946.1 phosphatidylglycerol:prolipoprotein diacylglycerol transferase [Moryella indoligenes]PSL11571.1 phosphatidylglycerol:prolipoprotein diacylglycerol transferase [Fusobacterium naviforme]STO26653.1 Prolipoprotein diacylglyceryl transferase [Fusobacterium naviforme]